MMFGPNKDMFHNWFITNEDTIIRCYPAPNQLLLDDGQPVSNWGVMYNSYQFQNGQIISDDCIGKY